MNREKRRAKIRRTIKGTNECPRLVVFRSNRYIYGQVIDDAKQMTVASVDKLSDFLVAGRTLAQKAIKKGIKKVVFDRAGYRYHGNVKKFADAVREAGLKF